MNKQLPTVRNRVQQSKFEQFKKKHPKNYNFLAM